MTPDNVQTPTFRVPVRTISTVIILAVLVYASIIGITADRAGFVAALQRLPTTLWLQLIALSLASYLLRFTRWQLLISSLGHSVPLLRSCEIYLSAFALTLTPGKAGETVRSIYLHPFGVSYPQSLGAFISERLLDLAAVAGFSVLALSEFPEYWTWALLILIGLTALFCVLRSQLPHLLTRALTKGSISQFASAGAGTIQLLLSGRLLVISIPLSLLAWIAQGVSLYLIVAALGYELSATMLIAIYCLSILAGAVSFIPGGLGATEAVIAVLLVAAGIEITDAVLASVVCRSLTLWLAVALGIACMLRMASRR